MNFVCMLLPLQKGVKLCVPYFSTYTGPALISMTYHRMAVVPNNLYFVIFGSFRSRIKRCLIVNIQMMSLREICFYGDRKIQLNIFKQKNK